MQISLPCSIKSVLQDLMKYFLHLLVVEAFPAKVFEMLEEVVVGERSGE